MLLFDHYRQVVGAGPDLPVAAAARRGARRCGAASSCATSGSATATTIPWVLRGVNLFIPRGPRSALVGLNGAGKSTLVKLLCRFYDPDRGSILWDGVDLRDLPVAELRAPHRRRVPGLHGYDLTAADNIGLGDLDALDDRGAHRGGRRARRRPRVRRARCPAATTRC